MNCCKFSLLRKLHRQDHSDSGFTIVELLVVIVVIGILATITIVAYTGISQKAILVSLQSDLSNSAQKLKMFQVEHGAYPAALNGSYCPADDTTYCLKASPGNSYLYSSASPYQSFSLIATNTNGISYMITDNSQPVAMTLAPLSPVADWLSTAQGDHYGNYYDLVNHGWASVTRSTPKTIYDPNDGRIHDVPAGYLAMNPWSAYQSGGRGSAAVIEEARTNYLPNSYGAANDGSKWTGGWSFVTNSSAAPAHSLVAGVYGSTAWRAAITGAVGDNAVAYFSDDSPPSSFAPGETATFSFWCKGSSSGINRYANIDAMGPSWLGTATVGFTLTSSWQRVTVVYSSLPANTTYVRLKFGEVDGGFNSGDTLDITIDAAQLEKGAFATSYIPTTTAAVTRNADVVTVPTTGWNVAAGTMCMVSARPINSGVRGGTQLLWRGTNSGTDAIAFIADAYDNHGLNVASGGVDGLYTGGGASSAAAVVAAYSYATGAPITGAVNGVAVTPSVGNYAAPSGLFATANIAAGSNWQQMSNGPIQRVTVYSSALSSSDVTTVTNAVKNGP